MDPDHPFRRVPKYDPIAAEKKRQQAIIKKQKEMVHQELLRRKQLNSLVNEDLEQELENKSYHVKSRRQINEEFLVKQQQKERMRLQMRLPSQNIMDKHLSTEMKYHTLGYRFGKKRLNLKRIRADLRNL